MRADVASASYACLLVFWLPNILGLQSIALAQDRSLRGVTATSGICESHEYRILLDRYNHKHTAHHQQQQLVLTDHRHRAGGVAQGRRPAAGDQRRWPDFPGGLFQQYLP